MLRRFFMMALADLHDAIRMIFGIGLDLAGRVVSLLAAPVSAEPKITLDMEADVTPRPAAPAEAEEVISLAVVPEDVYALAAAQLHDGEAGIMLGIEADVYVYNKAEAVLEEGPDFGLQGQPQTGVSAAVSTAEDLSIALAAEAHAPDAAPVAFTGNGTQLGLDGLASTPDACPMTAETDPVMLEILAQPRPLPACPVSGLAGVQLGIEAIVTVLPVNAVSAEMEITLDTAAELADKTAWIYPEQTAEYLYIRQVCNVVTDQA